MFNYFINDLEFNFQYKSVGYINTYLDSIITDLYSIVSSRRVFCGLNFIKHFRENYDFNEWVFKQDELFRKQFLIILNKIIDIDISDGKLKLGTSSDVYQFGQNRFKGQSLSMPEILYENDFTLVTPSPAWTVVIKSQVIKNGKTKEIFNLKHSVNIFLYETIYNEFIIKSYFQRLGFDLTPDFELDDWARISEDDKIEILSNFLTDHTNLISCRFEKIGKLGKSNKVMPLSDIGKSLYEYRLSTQNFRFYFQVINSKLIFLLGIVKKSEKIDKRIKNKLESKMVKK